MLRELRIKNLAVVEHASVTFGPGLNVLTGETGAGKSILIDAILLVQGTRASSELIRTDADAAVVEATFEVDPGAEAATVAEEAGLGVEDGRLIIRRELARSGRHRAFVNDSPVTLGFLERLGARLVDVHGQHEHQRLLEPATQLDLLDRFAETEDRRARIGELHAKHAAARAEVERARAATRERAQREDLLRFQVSELAGARIRAGEEAELRAERTRLQHAERFAAGVAEVDALIAEDRESALGRVARAARVIRELARLDPTFAGPAEALDTAAAQMEEALVATRRLRDAVVFEPGRLEAIDDRLDALGRLKRKYGDSEEAMLAFRAAAAAELERLAHHEELLAADERRLGELARELEESAVALSERRQAAAKRLASRVQKELRTLGMERAVFDVVVERQAAEDVGPRGVDRVELRVSTNPGEQLRPMARVASGGELSRAMLALHAVLAAADGVPTMIFDEVDAGIGGGTADVVGQKLAAAARGRQVLCVTHLAPIAARAARHLRVAKTVRAGRTTVAVSELEADDRVTEIARMLGGDGATDVARRHARELLARARG